MKGRRPGGHVASFHFSFLNLTDVRVYCNIVYINANETENWSPFYALNLKRRHPFMSRKTADGSESVMQMIRNT